MLSPMTTAGSSSSVRQRRRRPNDATTTTTPETTIVVNASYTIVTILFLLCLGAGMATFLLLHRNPQCFVNDNGHFNDKKNGNNHNDMASWLPDNTVSLFQQQEQSNNQPQTGKQTS
ncbi:hypothetical protein IV203_028125 [Nitzschia inconspicua]|uniref:Uncharacterized protein n=1 Tax=Nitzschia inconspicua TaxID=303405 RepID=A0A9K3Q6Q4_9STRA|nr:hypothetical protein IV203_028125 [Nitzschia inconspicua]